MGVSTEDLLPSVPVPMLLIFNVFVSCLDVGLNRDAVF